MPGPLIGVVMSDLSDELAPSKTYRLDIGSRRITGMIDGVEAVRQHVHKVLATERASFAVYGTAEGINYGAELERFIGRSFSFIQSDLERTITDALLLDERVLGISDFTIGQAVGDSLEVSFTVRTIFGDLHMNEEARIK